MAIAVFASLGAALLYAVASVLQQRAAGEVPMESSLRLGLLTRLLSKPWWIAGIVADVGAFGLQFIALGHGALVVVQPLLVTGLVFALPLGAWIQGARIRPSELSAGFVVAAGLAVLLVTANPGSGRDDLTTRAWIAVVAGTLLPVVILVLAAARQERARPALLAAGAGSIYGLTAALAKTSAHTLDGGIGHALGSWQVYALLPAGLLGMVVCQSAFQAGPLRASLPTLTAVDPIVSIAVGVLAFHEQLNQAPVRVVLEIAGAAAMLTGVVILARSPLVAIEEGATEEGATEEGATEEGEHAQHW